MSISGISPLAASTPTVTTPTDTATTNGASSSATNPTDALLAPNQFLTLLVDSLKYQDPLDPTSSADFLQQLASLSQVQTESQVAQTDQTSAAANLIGHTVTGNDPSGTSISGLVTGFSMTSSGPDLDIGNDSVIKINELAFTKTNGSITERKARLDLTSGAVSAMIDPSTPTITDFKIQTPQGVASARGTFYAVTVVHGKTFVSVDHGKVGVLADQ